MKNSKSVARSSNKVEASVKMDDFTKRFVSKLGRDVKAGVERDISILRKHHIICK